MSSIDEKRVYERNSDPETVFVASEQGIVAVSVAGGRVGTVSLRYRDPAFDLASAGDRIVAATAADVFDLGGNPTPIEFGPARTVAIDDHDRVLAAGETGLSRFENGEWRAIDGDRGDAIRVRDIDGDLIASEAGVVRITESGLEHAGLEAVRAVSSAGPYAATASGLYGLANGWIRALDGAFSTVTAESVDPATGADRRAHAVGDGPFERIEGEWRRCSLPIADDERVRDFAYGQGAYAVTDGGTLLIDENDAWRTYPLGVSNVRALAVTAR